jgi:hypothetical protein
MKYSKFILPIICFTSMIVNGQITVSNSTFPVVGDVLKTVTTASPSLPINVGNVNGPQTWFFDQLNQGTRITNQCKAPQTSPDFAGFPTANLLILDEGGQQQFYESTSTAITLLGLGGANDFLPVPVRVAYSQKPTFRRAPITFIQSSSSVGKFNVDLGTDIIPDSLLKQIPVPIDSIRIQFSSDESGVVDAYGTVKMQNKSTEVLREKIRSITDTKLFIKVSFVGWIDPTPLLGGGQIPGGVGGFLGADTTTIYNFYSATHKEILVSAEYNSDNSFRSATFADIGGIISSTKDQKIEKIEIDLSPNPTSNIVTLKAFNLVNDKYMMTVADMTGKILKIDFEQIEGNLTKDVDITDLPAGQYQIQLINKGRTRSYLGKVVKI